MTTLVSILVPAYNAAPWIAATLESALAQDHPRCEIIVVDDGSTDNTLSVAKPFTARGVRVITQANAGAAAARNHALRLSSGEFLQYLDADDLISPAKISTQLALLSYQPVSTLATCRWGRFQTDLNSTIFGDDDLARDFTPLSWMRLHCGAARMMHPAAWLVPRALSDQAGPWDERLSLNDDGEYFSRVVLRSTGISCAPLDRAQSFYRSGLPGSLSRAQGAQAAASVHLSVALIAAALEKFISSPETRQILADYWMRLSYELALDAPALAEDARSHAEAMGGSSLLPHGGLLFQLTAKIFGVRAAQSLRRRSASL